MSSTYVIQWRSKLNGRAGRGSKHFERAEAERLAEELNREYPQIEHAAVKLSAQSSKPSLNTAENHAYALTE